METAFVLGGFNLRLTATCDAYGPIRESLADKGYRVVPVDIGWRRKLPSQYTEEFLRLYAAEKTEYNVVIGNSFGAVVAFLAAPRLGADALYLCSLSPFFKEDRGKLPDEYGIRSFGKRRMADLWAVSAQEVAREIPSSSTVHVLYGEKENQSSPALVARCKDTASTVPHATLLEIPGAPHDMSDSAYAAALLDHIPAAIQIDGPRRSSPMPVT